MLMSYVTYLMLVTCYKHLSLNTLYTLCLIYVMKAANNIKCMLYNMTQPPR